MKTTLLKTGQKIAIAGLLLLSANSTFAQQVIGQFPTMDGGIEGQIAVTDASSTRNSTKWSISSNAGATVRNIVENAAGARSGTKYLDMQMSTGVNNCRFNSPTLTNGTDASYLASNTEYTIQYFYKAAADFGTNLTGGVYLLGTGTGSSATSAVTSTFQANQWVKATATMTSITGTPTETFATIRTVGTTGTATSGNTLASYDDFVIYTGQPDFTAPNSATAATYSRTGSIVTLGWTAASGGVDGGGYVVVRYVTTPNADNDLNQNGIYAVNNTTTNGTGSLEGTVVYIGTATTATITNPTSADYYYKIYTVDKAFNYSTELNAKAASLSNTKNEIVGLKVYPNPATDVLKIVSNSNATKSVKLTNLAGQVVLNTESNGTENLSGLTSGVYIATITEEGKTSTVKVVIK